MACNNGLLNSAGKLNQKVLVLLAGLLTSFFPWLSNSRSIVTERPVDSHNCQQNCSGIETRQIEKAIPSRWLRVRCLRTAEWSWYKQSDVELAPTPGEVAILARPDLAFDKNERVLVLTGTGRLNHPTRQGQRSWRRRRK